MTLLNRTHDPALTSWVTSANKNSQFPIQNLPYSIFRCKNKNENWRGGVAIGEQIVDLAALCDTGLLSGKAQLACEAASESTLNRFMAMGQEYQSLLRAALSKLLANNSPHQSLLKKLLILQEAAEYNLPCVIGDYTDFYTSIHHATSVGSLFRPDNPLLPNYKWVPIGYHGRSSTIGVSGQSFHRPVGQTKTVDSEQPSFGPCKRLDYEVEMGVYIGKENGLGEAIDIQQAEEHIFGFCLFNDWSARDIQAWEYQPLGPFLAKNFASTVSPWIVTLEALAPFRLPFTRKDDDPQPLAYLSSAQNSEQGALDITLDCYILTQKMRNEQAAPQRLSRSNFKHSYWSVAQLVTHHASNGCALNAGDLLGSGTQSGPEQDEAGSLLELSQGGKVTITLNNGESRTFLEDGDSIILRGFCQSDNAVPIGFGEVIASLLPARE